MLRPSLNRLKSLLKGRPPESGAAQAWFRSPSFTPEIVDAVRLISTNLALGANEASRQRWESESNQATAVELELLRPLLSARPRPRKVLEIGPGLGRSVVAFEREQIWAEDAEVFLYDTLGKGTKYKQKHYDAPPTWPDVSSFCGNPPVLQAMLAFNGVTRCTFVDAATQPLTSLPDNFDLVYGFYSIGFHWSVEHYMTEVDHLLAPEGIFVGTLNKHFVPFAALNKFHTRVLESPTQSKGRRPLSLLVISKSPLPPVGRTIAQAYG